MVRKGENLSNIKRKRNSDHNFYFYLIASLLFITLGIFFILGSDFDVLKITGNAISDIINEIENLIGISALSSNTFVTRYFSTSEYNPGNSFTVTLKINISSSDNIINYGIEEYVPSGWVISNVSNTDYYSINGNKIMWIANSSSNNSYLSNREIYYTVTPPVSDSGLKTFSSQIIFSSSSSIASESLTILGSSSINSFQNNTNPGTGSGSGGGGGGGGGSSNNNLGVNTSLSNRTIINSSEEGILGREDNLTDQTLSNETAIIDENPKNNQKSRILYYIIGIIIIAIIIAIVSLLIIKRNEHKNEQVL